MEKQFDYCGLKNMELLKFYENYVSSLLESYKPSNNNLNKKGERKLSIKYSWVNELQANGLEAETDSITITLKLILEVYSLFYDLVNNHPLILHLSEISAQLKCTEERIILSNPANLEETMSKNMYISNDSIRNNLAEFMSMFAIKFIIAHEFSHVYGGHSKYYNELVSKINAEIQKIVSDTAKAREYYLDIQAMELDADTFAATRIIVEALCLFKNGNINMHLYNNTDFFKIPFLAIHGVYYIFRGDWNKDGDYQEHPSTYIREEAAIGAGISVLEQYVSSVDRKFILDSLSEFEKIKGFEKEGFAEYVQYNNSSLHESAEKLRIIFLDKIAPIIKPECRMPIEGIDYT